MLRRALRLVLLILAINFCACSGSLFKVKPVTQLPPLPIDASGADGEGVTVRVGHILGDDESQELFEANLPLSGILAIRTELNFHSGPPVELKQLRFRLHDDQGRDWKLLSVGQTVSRILKAHEVSTYNPNSKKQFRQEFGAYALDLQSTLSPDQPQRSGFLFFQTPNKAPLDNTQRFTLAVERLSQTLTIPVN